LYQTLIRIQRVFYQIMSQHAVSYLSKQKNDKHFLRPISKTDQLDLWEKIMIMWLWEFSFPYWFRNKMPPFLRDKSSAWDWTKRCNCQNHAVLLTWCQLSRVYSILQQ